MERRGRAATDGEKGKGGDDESRRVREWRGDGVGVADAGEGAVADGEEGKGGGSGSR